MDKWVSIEQAANYLGVSVVTVRSWLREKAWHSSSQNWKAVEIPAF